MSKHTPGPWYVGYGETWASINAETGEPSRLALCNEQDGAVNFANARLMAVAPELYEVAETLLDYAREFPEIDLPTFPLILAANALRKVRGEA